MTSKRSPQSEEEWTVHALNIHGSFFEQWCAHVFSSHQSWDVRSTNYPVRYPTQVNLPGKETAVDIWAERRRPQTLLTFIVECKKNNPDFVNWVLLGNDTKREHFSTYLLTRYPVGNGWSCKAETSIAPTPGFIATDARETRGNYVQYARNDKTKTSNAAVSDAAYQLAIGVRAILSEEHARAQTPERAERGMEWLLQVIIPVIVTSARLFRASYDPANVDPATGELEFDDVALTEVPYAIYEYAVPRHLQDPYMSIEQLVEPRQIEAASRLNVILVTSSHLENFLNSQFVANLCI